MEFGQPDILSYNLATGDTSTVYADAGNTKVLRYEPVNDDFMVSQAKIQILDPSTETGTYFFINGTGPLGAILNDQPVFTFDLSKDGSYVYVSVRAYLWGEDYFIYKYSLGGASHGIIRSKAKFDMYNWWRDIREMENTDGWVLYTEFSPGTYFKSRIRITDGTYTVGVSLTTQWKDGNNSNPDYTTREVFTPR